MPIYFSLLVKCIHITTVKKFLIKAIPCVRKPPLNSFYSWDKDPNPYRLPGPIRSGPSLPPGSSLHTDPPHYRIIDSSQSHHVLSSPRASMHRVHSLLLRMLPSMPICTHILGSFCLSSHCQYLPGAASMESSN